MFDTNGYLKARSQNYTHIDVSEAEFKKLYIENGGKPEDASMQANISKIMGSYCKIGDKMIGVTNK